LRFILYIGIAIGLVVAGWYISITANAAPARFAFGIAAVAAELELFAAAWYLRSQSEPRFDMTIAAETVVAFGVFSLIGGIALAIFATRGSSLNIHDMIEGNANPVDLDILLISFGDGLLASAFAPLLATVMRHVEVLLYTPHTETSASGDSLELLKHDADRVANALAKLRTEVEAAAAHTASFAKVAKSIFEALNELAAGIRDARGAVPAALSSVSLEINSRGGQIAKALVETGSSLEGFKTGVTAGADTIRGMTGEFDRLSKEARAATGMLTRLQELIDSVTNFIRPHKP
jgi:methyl-accepting chemotaxis protein